MARKTKGEKVTGIAALILGIGVVITEILKGGK